MKKPLRLLFAAALTAAVLCGGALAAEEPTVGVQLNGQMLAFTDAVPQVREERTFLPFRAVFEAMGADVSNEGSVITAARDGKTLTMTIGSAEAQVTENGVTTPIVMDAAPYVDSATWRTYVPVRFAAQAFGCAVGWDQGAYTAIIADTGKLIAQAAQGKSFTYLEKLNAYSKKYSEGVWDCDLTMDGSFSILGIPAPIAVTAQGATEGETKVELDMNMKLDMAQVMALLGQMGGAQTAVTAEDQALLDAFKTDGIDMTVRGDLEKGVVYMNMAGAMTESAEMDPDVWYLIDMNALLGESGLDMTQLLQQNGKLDYQYIAKAFLNTLTLDTVSGEGYGTSYEVFKQSAENLVYALSDEGFIQEGDKYVASIDGGLNKMEISLTMKDGAVTAYNMTVNMTVEEEGVVAAVVVDMGVDEKDQVTGKMNMSVAPMLSMELNISGGCRKGTAAPVTEPPAGAEIADYMTMMADQLGTVPDQQ